MMTFPRSTVRHRGAASAAFVIATVAAATSVVAAPPSKERRTLRTLTPRAEFVQLNPCPANGRAVAACPGYIIEHAIPLCAGGRDTADNLVWRRASDARRREAVEQRYCGCVRNPPGNALVCPGGAVAALPDGVPR